MVIRLGMASVDLWEKPCKDVELRKVVAYHKLNKSRVMCGWRKYAGIRGESVKVIQLTRNKIIFWWLKTLTLAFQLFHIEGRRSSCTLVDDKPLLHHLSRSCFHTLSPIVHCNRTPVYQRSLLLGLSCLPASSFHLIVLCVHMFKHRNYEELIFIMSSLRPHPSQT